jgi:hypothetical protein
MDQIGNARPEQVSERDGLKLQWHDDERLQMYVSVGHDLVQRTPLGHQLECFRDNVRITGMPSTHPPGDWGFSSGTAYNRARETAMRLWDTERASPGSVGVLWDYCHPTAVALDGLPGGRGRIFVLYPRTELGSAARRPAGGGETCRLLGPRPCNCKGHDCSCWTRPTLVRRLYAEFVESKGETRALWFEIHKQAVERLRGAIDAWMSTRGAEDERRLQYQERRRTSAKARAVTSSTSEG